MASEASAGPEEHQDAELHEGNRLAHKAVRAVLYREDCLWAGAETWDQAREAEVQALRAYREIVLESGKNV